MYIFSLFLLGNPLSRAEPLKYKKKEIFCSTYICIIQVLLYKEPLSLAEMTKAGRPANNSFTESQFIKILQKDIIYYLGLTLS